MKRTVAIVLLGFVAACGGNSPTSPTTTTPTQTTVQTDPAPANPPTPTPAPTTPTPVPAPTPAPTPGPTPQPGQTVLDAAVSNSYWYPNASFTLPQNFQIVIVDGAVKIGQLDPLPFAYHESDDKFIVRTKDFEFSVEGGGFAFNGVNGTAQGSVIPGR